MHNRFRHAVHYKLLTSNLNWRYQIYIKSGNSILGTVIEVSCQRVKTDKSRTTLQTDTKKTNPTTASTNHFTDDGNNDVPFHTTPQPKTQTEDAIQINNLQKSSHAG